MRILITGAAGFIGSNLALALVKRGDRVVGVDNMSQGDERNLAGLAQNPGFTLHKADIRDEGAMEKAAKGCDVLVHLAAYKIPRYDDALETLFTNSKGSESVLRTARATGAKVVAASTSDVYGKNPEVPFTEDSALMVGNPHIKRWAYAISKMYEEQLLFAFHERYGMDVVALRFFGGYGPNQNLTWWGGPQSVFINAALDNQEMEIHGDGLQTRSFTYVDDHVDGIIRCIDRPEANNLVFNLGNTREISILGLARMIWGLVRKGEEPKIRIVPYATFGKYEDVRRRVPDTTRARTLLGFEARTGLEEGLEKTIRWQVARRLETGVPTTDPFEGARI